MSDIQLNYSDISDIFKEKLTVNNIVKTISSVFLNERYARKIDYKPYFQRNYVWDNDKATYFIESVLLGTEVPPIVLFQTKEKNEVIDGRQRYETIERFLNDRFALTENGLHCLKSLSGKKYSQISDTIREQFEETRIRILQFQVVNEPKLDAEKEDKIKKEIFRRYNSGITPLKKEEIERATYISDNLSEYFKEQLTKNEDIFDISCRCFLPIRKKNISKRDKTNVLVMNIRNLLTLPLVPIYSYAHASSKQDVLKAYYNRIVCKRNPSEEFKKYKTVISILQKIEKELSYNHNDLAGNTLFYEVLYWCVSIYLDSNNIINESSISQITESIIYDSNNNIFWNNISVPKETQYSIIDIFNSTGSHFYSAINNRYTYLANIFSQIFSYDYSGKLKNNTSFKSFMSNEEAMIEIEHYKLNKPLPETLTIEDIISDMKKDRFLIRPDYQRSEVKNIQKSSYLMESIMLGINIPPIFIYKRSDKVKEVVDGQQRLLSILGFLGKTYKDENGYMVSSSKDKFKLSKLRILTELNGINIDTLQEEFEDKILEFPLDIIEIDASLNPDFSQTDLFTRLNSKPYPIKENTFEMWNAYIDKDIILRIREIANKYENKILKSRDTRMRVEELVTSLAYLDYRMKDDGIDFIHLLNIYKRYNRFCARIMSKENVTKILTEISNGNTIHFIRSIDSVESFILKIFALINNDTNSLGKLFAHNKKGNQFKTDQNFYFLWMMLYNIDINNIYKNSSYYYNKINSLFTTIQYSSDDYEEIRFIYDCYKKWANHFGCIELEYLQNNWIYSSFVGGNIGWCHPDGTIEYHYNIGKWPTPEEVLDDLSTIASNFPFLDFTCTLMDAEYLEDRKPLVSFIVKDGYANIVEPIEIDESELHVKENDEEVKANFLQFLMSGDYAHSISKEVIKSWIKFVE